MPDPDAIIVGAGPNGLAAAITLARAGLSVLVLEAQSSLGGAARSAELTLPGFTHDICSAIHPFAYASPFFREMPLEKFGLEWIHSPAPLAHPLDGGRVVMLENSLTQMCEGLAEDGHAYRELLQPARDLLEAVLAGPSLVKVFARAFAAQFTLRKALHSAGKVAEHSFRREDARALFAGMAAHSMLPLEKAGTAGVALALLTAAHLGGWPFPRGGAQKISDALTAYLHSLGGRIETDHVVRDLRDLPPARAVLFDLTPRQVIAIAEASLPSGYVRRLRRFRYGIAAFKMDWALSDPVPWRSGELLRAATVHLGGTLDEIASAERAPWNGAISERPFAIVAQHSLFDGTRAPQGRHTLWAYCHVPRGCEQDMSPRIEAQIERFAPGFRDCVLARSVLPPLALEQLDENLIGGDITGGVQDLPQTLIRPTLRYWTTPLKNLYLCSSSTPPGVGVHGMCGHWAAKVALRRSFGISG
jgi:phytoene dehydrogenase-like protein